MAIWVEKHDDSFWTPLEGTNWNPTGYWQVNAGAPVVRLEPLGGWEVGYRPQAIRMTFSNVEAAQLELVDSGASQIASENPYSTLQEMTITFGADDLDELKWYVTGSHNIWRIEFLEDESRTRLYFPSSGDPDIVPDSWEFANQQSSTVTYKGVTSKIDTPMTTLPGNAQNFFRYYEGWGRWVYGPLAAQTIRDGYYHIQMRVAQKDVGINATLACCMKIIKPDGSDRVVLVDTVENASNSASSPYEFLVSAGGTTLTNRRAYAYDGYLYNDHPPWFPGGDVEEGDYLVVEIGWMSKENSGQSPGGWIRIGDTTVDDMEDDTVSTNDYAPWIDIITISGELEFLEFPSNVTGNQGGGANQGVVNKGFGGFGFGWN